MASASVHALFFAVRPAAWWLRGILASALMLVLSPSPAALAAELREGDTLTIGPGETIDDDLYIFGGTLTIQGTVTGDLVAAGGTITISGRVGGDALIAGGDITISGPIGGSIRTAGGNITITSTVQQDVLAAGGNVTVGDGARVGRDVWVGAGSTIINGAVGRGVLAGTGSLMINGTVNGDVQANTQALTLGSGAVVQGNLDYTSPMEAQIAPGARVGGATQHRVPEERPGRPGGGVAGAAIAWIQGLIGAFILGAIYLLIFPRFALRPEAALRTSPWLSLALGFGLLIGVPILALIAFIVGLIIGGWWIALFALALYALAIALAWVIVAHAGGRAILIRAGQPLAHPLLALIIGLVLLGIVILIPVLGGIIAFLVALFGLGALGLAVGRSLAPGPQPEPVTV